MTQVGLGPEKPVDDLPRSPSGRVPRWVIDEAHGRIAQDAVPWRRAYPSTQVEQPRRHGLRRWTRGLATAFLVLAVVG
ncbi:MAG TPA: hypothetical protein VIM49_09325, partial [Dermatophilaceae bacterium]